LKVIDVGGQLLFLVGIGLLMLAFAWAPRTYSWDSAAVLCPLIVGSVVTLGFLCWEFLMAPSRLLARLFPRQRPMLPWEFLSQRNIGLLFYINLATGIAMYAVYYFTSLYFEVVEVRDSKLWEFSRGSVPETYHL
jgi:hypothetical protein